MVDRGIKDFFSFGNRHRWNIGREKKFVWQKLLRVQKFSQFVGRLSLISDQRN